MKFADRNCAGDEKFPVLFCIFALLTKEKDMKTTKNENGTTNFYGCTKTINLDGIKRKVSFDMLNFTRENPDLISEYDLAVNGSLVGHVEVPYSDLYRLDGVAYRTEKSMLEYAVARLSK